MKEFEKNIFAAIFFGLWIVVLAHLLAKPTAAVQISQGLVGSVNSFFGTLFTGRAS